MADSRLHNAKRNIGFGFICRIVEMLLPFLTRTAIIYCLGALYLGLNSLYSSILNVLSLAELGFSSAMVFSMYEPLAKNDTKAICALLNLYRKIYRLIGLVIIVIGLVLLFPLPHLIKGEVPSDINIYWLYLIFLGNTGLSYFLYAYKESILVADQRSDILSNIQWIVSTLSGVCQLIVLLVFKNYYLFCLVWPVFTIIRNLTTRYIVERRYPDFKCYGRIANDELSDIKKRVGGLFIYKLCYVFRDSFASIIISSFLGLTVLAQYNNYAYICGAITGFLTIVKNSITAGIGNSIATESQAKNFSDFNKCQMLYMWVSIWCTVCLFCLLQPFIKLWIGESYLLPLPVVFLFCIQFLCYKLGDVCAVYRHAAGLWWQDHIRPIVEAVTCLVLSFVFVRILDVSGVLIASIFCLVFINSIWASWVLFKYYFKSFKQIQYIKRVAFYFLVAIFVMAVTFWICNLFDFDGWPALLVNGLICLIVPNIIIAAFFYVIPEYKVSITFLRKILSR